LRKKSIDNLSLLSCREEIASESQYEEIVNEFKSVCSTRDV